jgi:fatty acid desaturase
MTQPPCRAAVAQDPGGTSSDCHDVPVRSSRCDPPKRQLPRPCRSSWPPASSARARGSEYAQLSRQIKEAGLLGRRQGCYIWKITLTAAALACGWAALIVVGDSWRQLAVAAFLAVIFTQIGFLGHDAGHRQVFASGRASYLAGLLLRNLGIGLSYD